MERYTYFVQVEPFSKDLVDTLFIQRPADFFPGTLSRLSPENILIRRERQTFRRLPKSETVLFTVKTSLQRLTQLPMEELEGFVGEARLWPDETATCKGRELWGPCVFAYYEECKSWAHNE